jgi:hypothetical protein
MFIQDNSVQDYVPRSSLSLLRDSVANLLKFFCVRIGFIDHKSIANTVTFLQITLELIFPLLYLFDLMKDPIDNFIFRAENFLVFCKFEPNIFLAFQL